MFIIMKRPIVSSVLSVTDRNLQSEINVIRLGAGRYDAREKIILFCIYLM